MRKKSRLTALLVSAALCFSMIAGFAQIALAAGPADADINVRYAAAYYGVAFGETVTERAFADALGLTMGDGEEDGPFGYARAAVMTVVAAGMEELALTYSAEKAGAVFAALDIAFDAEAYAASLPYLAAAVDLGLADPAKLFGDEDISAADAADMLVAAYGMQGLARAYLGRTSEPDVYGKLAVAFTNFAMPLDEELVALGNAAVKAQIVTGYNIRDNRLSANFEPELSIRYGHSDLAHALQLAGLLRSEGIDALIAIEPKVSAFEYLLDWGPVPDPYPTFYVNEEGEDFYIAYALEYDLVLEFANAADRNRFDGIILAYAKKNSGEEDKARIVGSWWQPFYSSTITWDESYAKVSDNVVGHGDYALHTTSLDEALEAVQAWFAEAVAEEGQSWFAKAMADGGGFTVASFDQYVNLAFHRYLNGESE